ncbi:hypothetical protein AQJ91_05490 [Streptomyces dysideae]|uniref:Uncharacterized protein n=1 Tax=Streptomyces dysideae TaxID=909626 RepID=A0A124IFN8_9ACTN|nr:hypothetical protein AQJ91_05490 [Streptomyces dysideae]
MTAVFCRTSGKTPDQRALHDSVPPVRQAFRRWLLALVVVAPFGARQGWRQRKLIRRHLDYVLLGVTVYNTLSIRPG